jgi:hypothetical protein
MVPPFIAYYGALQGGPTGDSLLQVAYEQVKLYRDVLFDEPVGLWRHIALGSSTDPTHWGTGNAWAAAGALRVLATIQRSCVANSMKSQQDDLVQWVGETLDGVWKFQVCDLFVRSMLVLFPPFFFNFKHDPSESERNTAELHRRARLVLRHLLNCAPGGDHVPFCVDHWRQKTHPRCDSGVEAGPRQRGQPRMVAKHGRPTEVLCSERTRWSQSRGAVVCAPARGGRVRMADVI